ncbi:hypothetical protein RS030_91500 [Cryptosporidium xiaoi]|uniref:Uncharacterized protein n=1 Tax=Cryptosporidium xiaoi TaxID=659607 RepID=A0AAV9XUR0_9CRYT
MVSRHSVIGRFAFLIFSAIFFLINNVNGIDELDVLLCGPKGNQYYVSSTPFITRGAYLYADLLIKAVKAPWPVRPTGVPYTRDELKLALVKNVILTSPLRLRYMVSQLNPPRDIVWSIWMDKLVNYPKVLSIINDLRFSVFLCGPDMLDSKIIQKFIRRINKRYAHYFNPYKDKVVIAALKLHGIKDEEVNKKSEIIEMQLDSTKQPTEKTDIRVNVNSDSKFLLPKVFAPDLSDSYASQIPIEKNEKMITNKPVILSDSEFDEFRDEKSVESDFDKTPSFTDENSNSDSQKLESIKENIEIPELNIISERIENKKLDNNIDDIRVSSINKDMFDNDISSFNIVDYTELPELEGLSIDRTRGAKFGWSKQNSKETSIPPIVDINSSNILEPTNIHNNIYLFNSKSPINNETGMLTEYISNETSYEGSAKELSGVVAPTKYDFNLFSIERTGSNNATINLFDSKTSDSETLKEEIRNYEDDYEDEDAYDDEDDIENMTDEEYYKYLDYKYHTQTNKNEMSKYGSTFSHEKSLPLKQNYPLGKQEKAPKAYLQDVSSVLNDLFNAVNEGKLSPKNILYGIPDVDLKFNTRSKPISFNDRIVKKWRAQEVDGVLKSIPIFHVGDIDRFNNENKNKNSNQKKELSLIEVNFDSALASHDKNEGGYNWLQKNLYLTKTTSGFQDILIKAAIKSLEIITSIQCSSILEKSVSSKEVNDCIIAYFGSIKYAQNKVYGSITKDEDDTIQGYEVIEAIRNKNPVSNQMNFQHLLDFDDSSLKKIFNKNIVSSETNGADEIIKKHLLGIANLNTYDSESQGINQLKRNEINIFRNLDTEEINEDDESLSYDEDHVKNWHSGGISAGKSQVKMHDEVDFDSDEADRLIKEHLVKGGRVDEQKTHPGVNDSYSDDSLSPNLRHRIVKPRIYKKHDGMLNFGVSTSEEIEDENSFNITNKDDYSKKMNLYSFQINNDHFNRNLDPEFIDSALEKLAYNVTEVYKKVITSTKIVSKDANTTIHFYEDFIEKIRLWGAIAGEALKFTGRKLSSIFAGEKQRLSYLYTREEFYVYYAIIYYTINIIKIFKIFNALRETLNQVKELLKESFDSNIDYNSVVRLSDRYMRLEQEFNENYYGNVDVFCGTMSLVECLKIMKDDFYRRNEKFTNFISRNSGLRKALGQIFELFGIDIHKMGEIVLGEGISREDVSRYLLVREYIGRKSNLITKKSSSEELNLQIRANERDANIIISGFLERHDLESKIGSCGKVMWVGPSKNESNNQHSLDLETSEDYEEQND